MYHHHKHPCCKFSIGFKIIINFAKEKMKHLLLIYVTKQNVF